METEGVFALRDGRAAFVPIKVGIAGERYFEVLSGVTEGDQINTRTPPNGGGKKIRAYDKASGQVLWETQLEAGSTGTLMTYLHKGKQYIVVAIGGVQHPAEFVAFSLP